MTSRVLNPDDEVNEVKKFLQQAESKMPSDVVAAHKHSSNHRAEILASQECSCFYCLKQFTPDDITTWVNDGQCAICPKCGIDAVIGDQAGYSLDKPFLQMMHKYWFS